MKFAVVLTLVAVGILVAAVILSNNQETSELKQAMLT